jgi:hypothetical protein
LNNFLVFIDCGFFLPWKIATYLPGLIFVRYPSVPTPHFIISPGLLDFGAGRESIWEGGVYTGESYYMQMFTVFCEGNWIFDMLALNAKGGIDLRISNVLVGLMDSIRVAFRPLRNRDSNPAPH